jgi:hypothetical protein
MLCMVVLIRTVNRRRTSLTVNRIGLSSCRV